MMNVTLKSFTKTHYLVDPLVKNSKASRTESVRYRAYAGHKYRDHLSMRKIEEVLRHKIHITLDEDNNFLQKV